MKCLTIIFSLSIFLLSCGGRNNVKTIEVAAGDRDLVNAPVFADIDLDYFGGNFQVCLKIGNEIIPGQIENLTGNKKRVWWLANVKKGESANTSYHYLMNVLLISLPGANCPKLPLFLVMEKNRLFNMNILFLIRKTLRKQRNPFTTFLILVMVS
jgi:hypothetical protein